MMFHLGGMVCSMWCGYGCGCMMYCTVRYAFDDLIDKIVATQQQSQLQSKQRYVGECTMLKMKCMGGVVYEVLLCEFHHYQQQQQRQAVWQSLVIFFLSLFEFT